MKKILITFGGDIYDETTKLVVENGLKYGADEVWVYDDLWLTQQDFYKQNSYFWEHPHKRGFGWYIWKPFIIWHALQKLEDGDIVMFTDADCYPIANFSILYDICNWDGGIMLFAAETHKQWKWCKRDTYIVMAQDKEEYRDVQAGVARFMLFQKGVWKSTQFLMEWLTYCVNPLANTFDPSVLGTELDGFIEARAEQAIMSNLSYKYKLKLYRELCEGGAGSSRDRDLYQQLFSQVNPHKIKKTAEVKGSKYFNIEPRCSITL